MTAAQIAESDNDWHNRLEYHQNDDNVYDGIIDTINILSSMATLLIVSSNITEFIKRKLKQENIPQFSEIIGGDLRQSKVDKLKKRLPSGIYLYQLKTNNFEKTYKMFLLE